MKLDSKALASAAVTPLRVALQDALKGATPEAKALAQKIREYEDDVAQVTKALQEEKDPLVAAMLADDLERFLPARRAAIVSQAASLSGAFVEEVLIAALGIAEGIAFAVARAYVPALGAVDLEGLAKKAEKGFGGPA